MKPAKRDVISFNIGGEMDSVESSWTMYFEDFLADDQEQSLGYASPSLVSDAASSAAPKFRAMKNMEFSLGKEDKKLSRKRRKIEADHDDPFEDTASSTDGSLKGVTSNQVERNPKHTHPGDSFQFQGKGKTSGHIDEREYAGYGNRGSHFSKLQKRGLCLVPLSTAVKHLA